MADLDDTLNVIPLDEQLRLAKRRGPMPTKDEATVARLIDAAFESLDAVVADNHDVGTSTFRAEISEYLRMDSNVRWLAKGAGEQPGRWSAVLLTIEGKDKTSARAVKSAVQAEAKRLSTSGTRETRHRDLTDRGLLPPPGYVVDATGVWIEGGEQIATRPIYIVGRGRNIAGRSERFLRLRWAEDEDDFEELTVDRASAMDSRGLLRCAAADGAPITSANALAMTRYLDAFETENVASLPLSLVTQRLGWQPNGSFLIGAQCIGLGSVELVDPHRAADWRSAGEWQDWQKAYDMVAGMPLMVLAVIGSVAAPLLTILDAQGFVIDWSGETSAGKTTALRMAASVWGVPDTEAPNGPMLTWKSASTAGPLADTAFRHSLPMILDDTKEAKSPEIVAQLLYQIPSGHDVSRSDRDGTKREPRTWRTVLLSSGEAPIVSFSRDGGARARTISVNGPPMGESTPVNAARAEHVKDLLNRSHGHLGERVISELIARPDHYRGLYARHKHARAGELAGAAARVAQYLAVLDTARCLMEAAGVASPSCDPVGYAASCVDAMASSSDPPTEALRTLYAYCAGNQAAFEGRDDPRHHGPPLIGVWGGHTLWREIALQKQVVEELLTRWRYDAASVMESWTRRGWRKQVANGKGRLSDPKVRFGGEHPRMLVLYRDAIDALNNEE